MSLRGRPRYDTPQGAMRATLEAGNNPCLRRKVVRTHRIDVHALAAELGCTVQFDPAEDLYEFTPAN